MALAPSWALLGVPSRASSRWSTSRCSEASKPRSSGADRVERRRSTALLHALAAVALAAVAQLDRLEGAGGRAGGDRCAADGAVVEGDLDLDGGVASRVEDLASADCLDGRHGVLLVGGGCGSFAHPSGGIGADPGRARPATRRDRAMVDVRRTCQDGRLTGMARTDSGSSCGGPGGAGVRHGLADDYDQSGVAFFVADRRPGSSHAAGTRPRRAVLDVGCGRGAVALQARPARWAPTAR